MRVLGIHDGHNASVCLIENGVLQYAVQEERLAYQKNKGGFPKLAVEFLLKHFNLNAGDIDFVAMASTHTSIEFETGDFYEKHKTAEWKKYLERMAKKTPLYSVYKQKRRQQRLDNLKEIGFSEEKVHFVDHHVCHAATAYFGSHFPPSEKVLVLTNDGAGDGLCATVTVVDKGQFERIVAIPSTDSLATIYCMVTKMLGFTPLEHEYKLMGMAPYCSSKGTELGYDLFRDLVKISPTHPMVFERTSADVRENLMPLLQKRFLFARFDNICAGLQKFTEEILVQWVQNCIRETGIKKIALAGGVFMNVKANKKIMELPEVEDLFIFPSCGDETVALGAAYWIYHERRNNLPEIAPLQHFYLGHSFTDEEALEELKKSERDFSFTYKKWKNIEKEVAKLLAEGKVVARCKENMEFGARALGNRSILANPADLGCLREINLMVKKRDFWMPFAPVMMQERQQDYIVNPKKIAAPYMIMSFDTTPRYGDFIAAVHQADLTARPQVITKEMNPEYYKILKEFETMTGRGVLLNTSFNLHGYPIVQGPKEALDVFKNSGLQYLALGNYLVVKK